MKKYEYIYAYQIGQYPDWEIVELIKNDNNISESGLIIAKEDKIINDKEQEIERLNNNWNKLENYIEDKRDYYDNQDYAYYMFNQVLEYLKELKGSDELRN